MRASSLKSEPGLRAVVLSGDGPSFCAGLDFSSFQAMAGGDDGRRRAAERPARAEGNPGVDAGRSHHPPRPAGVLGVAGTARFR